MNSTDTTSLGRYNKKLSVGIWDLFMTKRWDKRREQLEMGSEWPLMFQLHWTALNDAEDIIQFLILSNDKQNLYFTRIILNCFLCGKAFSGFLGGFVQ